MPKLQCSCHGPLSCYGGSESKVCRQKSTLPEWENALRRVEQRLEDGDISYCAAIDLLDDIKSLPRGVKQHMTTEWEKKGCPDVKR